MFTFTLTADSAEELNTQILAAAEKIAASTGMPLEQSLVDFSLQEIAEHLERHGYKVSPQ